MGIFDRKNSTDGVAGKVAIDRLKARGGTANLSNCQIAKYITKLDNAKTYLTTDEYEKVCGLFRKFKNDTACRMMDSNEYAGASMELIRQYEQIAPFIFFDGVNSKDIPLSLQFKIRGLHNRGVAYNEAVSMIKSDPDSIEPYYDYDPVGDREAKRIAKAMYKRALVYLKNNIEGNKKDDFEYFGYILSLYDLIFRYNRKAEQVQEQYVVFYLIMLMAMDNMPDEDINVIMRFRRDLCVKSFKKLSDSELKIEEAIPELVDMADRYFEDSGLKAVGMLESLNAMNDEILGE